jgi:hypothetical protein
VTPISSIGRLVMGPRATGFPSVRDVRRRRLRSGADQLERDAMKGRSQDNELCGSCQGDTLFAFTFHG